MSYDFSKAAIEVEVTCSGGQVIVLRGQFPDGTLESFIVTSDQLFPGYSVKAADIAALQEACTVFLDKLPDLPDD